MVNSGLHMGDVVDSIRRHKVVIVSVSIIAAVAGAIFYLAGPKKYEGKSEFIMRNPIYGDRANIYSYETKYLDYFANEDDIDRLMVVAESDLVDGRVIRNLNMAKAYGIDTSDPKGADRVAKKFAKNLNVTRTEYKSVVVSFVDENPVLAAKVTNECVAVLDSMFTNYFIEMRRDIYMAVTEKLKEEDSSINAMTDTLIQLRIKYGINDIISPARNNLMLSEMKPKGSDFPRGLELVQNIESLKDQLVTDRARQITLLNQYKTGVRTDQLPTLKVLTYAKTPVSPKGIGGINTVLASLLLGFFFTTIVVSFSDRYLSKPLGK